MVELLGRVVRGAPVHGTRLDDRRPGRLDEPEPGAHRRAPGLPGRLVAAAGPFTLGYLTKSVFAGYSEPMPLRYAGVSMCAIFLIGLIALLQAYVFSGVIPTPPP